jgi:hypothetical protein
MGGNSCNMMSKLRKKKLLRPKSKDDEYLWVVTAVT